MTTTCTCPPGPEVYCKECMPEMFEGEQYENGFKEGLKAAIQAIGKRRQDPYAIRERAKKKSPHLDATAIGSFAFPYNSALDDCIMALEEFGRLWGDCVKLPYAPQDFLNNQ